jgi:hypothetical protein
MTLILETPHGLTLNINLLLLKQRELVFYVEIMIMSYKKMDLTKKHVLTMQKFEEIHLNMHSFSTGEQFGLNRAPFYMNKCE